jgi:hypothetical protein
MKKLLAVLAVLTLAAGCASTTISIPAQVLNPSAPADAAPARYSSTKDVYIHVMETPDSYELTVSGDASTVESTRGDVIVGYITAGGQVIPVVAAEAAKFAAAP